MKRILPVLSILTLPFMLCACNDDKEKANYNFSNYKANINQFQQQFKEYASLNDQHLNKLNLNKYRLSINVANPDDLANDVAETDAKTDNNTTQLPTKDIKDNNQVDNTTSDDDNIISDDTKLDAEAPQKEVLDEQQPTVLPNTDTSRPIVTEIPTDQNENKDTTKLDNDTKIKISTLYSLTDDVDSECDNFCQLKKQLVNAIVETQNLIEKVNKNEVDLTNEQRIFLTEQSSQLKNLGKRLSVVTNELNFSVNDLSKLINANGDLDEVTLKYLLVLNNLNSGNSMLEDGLYSLNMINQLLRMPNAVAGNNQGRILYGFTQNGKPPVVYDYMIDKDGKVVENVQNGENQTETDNDNTTNTENQDNGDQSNDNKRTWLTPNIDSYGNFHSNIDTFYNTALLDRFGGAYGRNFYNGNGGFNGFYAPNMYGYPANYLNGYNQNFNNPNINYGEFNNTTNGVQTNYNTQDNQTATQKKPRKKIKITKNIDTYKTDDTLTPKQRFAKIKNSVGGFFAKFKKQKPNSQNSNFDTLPQNDLIKTK